MSQRLDLKDINTTPIHVTAIEFTIAGDMKTDKA